VTTPPLLTLMGKLTQLIPLEFGRGHRLVFLEKMPDGHAGLTFGLQIAGADNIHRSSILKLGPVGVRRSGSTDIYRQARLLNTLHSAGLPVPSVVWSSPDEGLLGAPFIVMERLPGRTLIIWEPHATFLANPEALTELWVNTAAALAMLHRFAWRTQLADWEEPSSLLYELERWAALLRHCEDPEWRRLAVALLANLRSTMPADTSIGLVHGDFQPGNLLYENGRITGIIDWDLASIAPQEIDVGWLMMMADRESWAEGWKPHSPLGAEGILRAYTQAGGTAHTHARWFQAFAHFRMGGIAGLNLK
jgi:aminoglycoside phosphotransferase (APT) family kinase protein